MNATVHASAVVVDGRGVLIRGPSGSGKSRLAFDLLALGFADPARRAKLVGDDRLLLAHENGQLWVRPAPELRGLIEIRGLGIRRCDFVQQALVALVVDLAAGDAARMPEPEALKTTVEGVDLPRIPVAAGAAPLPLVLAALLTAPLSEPQDPGHAT
jgi:HPr kinase/phosphorylase